MGTCQQCGIEIVERISLEVKPAEAAMRCLGMTLGSFHVGRSPIGVAVVGSNIWVVNFGNNNLLQRRPETVASAGMSCRLTLQQAYSYLSATSGSTLAARRAGTKQAPRATPIRINEISANVAGSVADTL